MIRLLENGKFSAYLPGHTLVMSKRNPGSYDLECVDEGCDYKTGIIVSETTHSSYKRSHGFIP